MSINNINVCRGRLQLLAMNVLSFGIPSRIIACNKQCKVWSLKRDYIDFFQGSCYNNITEVRYWLGLEDDGEIEREMRGLVSLRHLVEVE